MIKIVSGQTKVCIKCDKEKTLDNFSKRKTYKDGYNTCCILCTNTYMKEYNKTYYKYRGLSEEEIKIKKEKINAYNRTKAKENWKTDPTKLKEQQKAWRDNNPDKSRNRKLKNKYGITSDDYNKMFIEQNGKCKTCGRNQNEFKIRLCVDHNHKTGKIRGLLCADCNIALGKVKENITTLDNLKKLLQDDKDNNWME